MANQQLVGFIRDELRAGKAPADIRKSLATAGWPGKYIDEGFLEVNPVTEPKSPFPSIAPLITPPSIQTTVPLEPISPPTAQPPSSSVASSIAGSATPFSLEPITPPTIKAPDSFVPLTSSPMQTPPSSVPITPPAEQTPVSSEPVTLPTAQTTASSLPQKGTVLTLSEAPSSKSKRGVWIALSIIAIVVILGGAATYAYIAKIGPFAQTAPYTADNLLSGILKSFSQINTSTYSLSGSLKVNPRESDAVPWTTRIALSPDLTIQYQSDARRSQDVIGILESIQYKNQFPASLQTIANGQPSSHFRFFINDPVTEKPYSYTLTKGGKNFTLIVTFETDAAISAIKNSYKFSATSTPITGKLVTFTKDSPIYFYVPNAPPKPFLIQLGESMAIVPAGASSTFSVSGATDWSKSNADWKFNFGAKADLGDLTYNVDFDALRKNEVYYFRVNHFPEIFLMFVESLANIKGTWIKVDAKATSSSSIMNYDPLSSLASGLPDAEKSYKENRQDFIDTITKATSIADSEHLFTLKNAPKSEQVDGRELYRYDLKINKDAIVPFYRRLSSEADPSMLGGFLAADEGYITYLQGPEFNELFDFYDKNTSLTLWVDSYGFPAIISNNLRITPPDTALQLKDKQINLSLKLTVSNINEPVNIDAPKDAKPIQELIAQYNKGKPTSTLPVDVGGP